MRKSLLILATAVMALAACNKQEQDNNGVVEGQPVSVDLKLTTKGVGTKVTEDGTAVENKINTVDIFIFNSDGNLDAYKHFDTSAATYTVNATTGTGKDLYAVVNAVSGNALASVLTKTDLEAKVFNLTDNTTTGTGSFQMVGSKANQTLAKTPDTAHQFTVAVDRTVARIQLKKITRDFTNPVYATYKFYVKGVYVSNAVGTSKSLNASPYMVAGTDTWFHKYYGPEAATVAHTIDLTDATVDGWLGNVLASTVALAEDASSSTVYTFYTMPNNFLADPAHSENPWAWAPELTKLVVEAQLGPDDSHLKTYYYVIPIVVRDSYPDGTVTAGITKNNTYVIDELVITRPGSNDADTMVTPLDVQFTITVNPWTVNTLQTEAGKFVI